MNNNLSTTSNSFTKRFTIIKELGSGAFCTVYLGYDTLHKQNVAIKIEKKKRD